MAAKNTTGRNRLPFTPFHMGAALIVKPATGRNFSVITFGIAQIAMDIEPGIGMLTGADVLHGSTHTILGALAIACLVVLIAPAICRFFLKMWNKEVRFHKQDWLIEPDEVSRVAVATGAFFGTLSHILLDSLMHHDIHPLAPFSQANPLKDIVSHDGVYQLCTVVGAFGVFTWLAMKRIQARRQKAVTITSSRTFLWVILGIVTLTMTLRLSMAYLSSLGGEPFRFPGLTDLLMFSILAACALAHRATDAEITADGKVTLIFSKLYNSFRWSGASEEVAEVIAETCDIGDGDETRIWLAIKGLRPVRMYWDVPRASQFAIAIGKTLCQFRPDKFIETLDWQSLERDIFERAKLLQPKSPGFNDKPR